MAWNSMGAYFWKFHFFFLLAYFRARNGLFFSFWVILKIQIMHFQELFTESKKLAVLSFSVVAKLARSPKSRKILYIFDFPLFQSENWANLFFLAPNTFWNPIFGQVVAFHEFSKLYLGIWLIFWFLAIFGGPKLKDWNNSVKKHCSSTSDPKRGQKSRN